MSIPVTIGKRIHIDLGRLLDDTADGAMVLNQAQRIIYWNQAAQKILGYTPDKVVGQTLQELLGFQIYETSTALLAENSRAIPDMRVLDKAGQVRWINISVLSCSALDDDAAPLTVYLFRDSTQAKRNERFVHQVIAATKALQSDPPPHCPHPDYQRPDAGKVQTKGLTDRECEVLNLLAQGLSTQEIAQSLFISPTTTRNHIQNILRKLDAHNRLEAVINALQSGFVSQALQELVWRGSSEPWPYCVKTCKRRLLKLRCCDYRAPSG